MTKRICFISYDGMTDPLGQSQVLPYLVGLAQKGHDITLISFEKKERFWAHKSTIDTVCENAKIHWYPQLYTKKPPVFSTLYDVWKMRRTLHSLNKKKGFDIIHARSYISMLAAFPMRKKGLCVVFDMRGFWADERVDGALWNLNNPVFKWIYSFFKNKEKQWLTHSDAVVSLTYAAAHYIKEEMKIDRDIAVIPCCTDEVVFCSAATDTEASDDLLYVGSLGTWYLLDEMLRFFRIWKRHFPGAKFRFISLENPDSILKAAAKWNLKADDFLIAAAARHEVAARMEGARAGIFFLKKAFSKMASSPVKQGEMMAMGLPIFCNTEVGDSGFIVEKYDSGILVPEYSDEAFENAIRAYLKRDFVASRIRAGAVEYFSLKEGIESYHTLYQSL